MIGSESRLSDFKSPTGAVRVYFPDMFAPLIVSTVVPFYYGYTHALYSRVVVWALACTVGFYWLERWTFKTNFSAAQPVWVKPSAAVFFVLMITLAFLAIDTLVYGFAKSI